jgi:hypothetical protein
MLDFGALTKVSGELYLNALANLASLAGSNGFPKLKTIGSGLTISGNPRLTALSLPMLTTLGYCQEMSNNPMLPDCLVTALTNQIVPPMGCFNQSGNGSGTCN